VVSGEQSVALRPQADPQTESVEIVGVPVSAISMPVALENIAGWIGKPQSRYVCVADVHSVMQARANPSHMASMRGAAMVTPDGTPLVWVGRLLGRPAMSRVCGPDLLPAVCAASEMRGWRHYFYGGAPGVVEQLRDALTAKYPKLDIVGTYSPPFRPLSEAEDAEVMRTIAASKADIVWVGLGCPKQEKWMADHVARLAGVTLIGIGAAFDFHTGRVERAPLWMQRNGLEWLHRLVSEPRRLWRRYLVLAPQFALLAGGQVLKRALQRGA
jgi:N-acetylglucosaminyldiphosphoundecaprenol N-acetyl-beta-D-mannosaminyltransferase